MTKLVTTFLCVAIFGFVNNAVADDSSDLEKMKSLLKMGSGNRNEGRKDNRNSVGTGSVKDWLTYPGDLHVKPKSENEKWQGRIEYYFTGRERVADYVLGQQRDTNDHQTSGKVTADYEIGRSGKLNITSVKKHDGRGRVGNSVVSHIKELDGKSVR